MKELVTTAEVNRLFVLLALLVPVPALLATLAIGRVKKVPPWWYRAGILVAVAAPLNLLLWKLYEHNTNALGLDTVKNVVVNLVIFTIVGVTGGVVIAKLVTAPSSRDSQQPKGD